MPWAVVLRAAEPGIACSGAASVLFPVVVLLGAVELGTVVSGAAPWMLPLMPLVVVVLISIVGFGGTVTAATSARQSHDTAAACPSKQPNVILPDEPGGQWTS